MGRLAVAAAVVVLVFGIVVMLFVASITGSDATVCGEPQAPVQSAAHLDADQLGIARTIVSVVDQRHLPDKAAVIAVATGLVESQLRNLDYGDRDSLGVFQQRPSQGWGTPAQIMDPVYATGKFLDGLVGLPDWQAMAVGDAAQRVQNSGHPERYGQRAAEASQIVGDVRHQGGGALPAKCAPPNPVDAPAAVKRALSQIGKPYCWGGGSQEGPTPGDGSSPPPCGPRSPGFDCSGLMLFAFAPYVSLPRTSRAQYQVPGGVHVPVASAQPGDMLFWAKNTSDPDTIHHVAMVSAPGQLVEAPQDGETVHQRPLNLASSELMPTAVRMVS